MAPAIKAMESIILSKNPQNPFNLKPSPTIDPPVAKNNIKTGRGYCKNLAAAPLAVCYMRFQAKPELHVK
jgi:hypothetical protein